VRGAGGQRLRVRLLGAEQAGDLVARLGCRCYVNGVHRVSLLPVPYLGVGIVGVAPVGHPQDLADGAQAREVL